MPCAIYAPKRQITQLALEILNVPGTLAAVASEMARMKANILSGLIWAEPDRETATWIFFVDLTETGLEPEEFARRLEGLKEVRAARVVERRFGDLLVDAVSFPTTFLGRRMVLLDVCSVGAMLDWIDRTFGTGGHVILFDMGKEAGTIVTRVLKERYGLSGRQLLEAFLALCTSMGWFRYEIVSLSPEGSESTVRLYDSYECSYLTQQTGPSGRPRSHLVRGVLAGVFEVAFGREVVVREVKCVAKGDPYCEFVVKPAER